MRTIISPCLGCLRPLTYEIDLDSGAPDILPPGAGAVAYRNGHLCSGCAVAVEAMLKKHRPISERAQRAANAERGGAS